MKPIYVDMDDVLTESTKAFIQIIHREFGRSIRFEDIHSFDLKTSFGLSDDEFDHFFDLAHQPDAILSYAPMEGAIESLRDWSRKGCDISIVTGRLTSAYDASKQWLSDHKVPYTSFFTVNKYGRENMDPTLSISLEQLSEKQFCFAVEDSADMARYLSLNMQIPVFLYDRPWNRKFETNGSIKRFNSWKALAGPLWGFPPEQG